MTERGPFISSLYTLLTAECEGGGKKEKINTADFPSFFPLLSLALSLLCTGLGSRNLILCGRLPTRRCMYLLPYTRPDESVLYQREESEGEKVPVPKMFINGPPYPDIKRALLDTVV